MPTPAERLATLEAEQREMRDDVRSILDVLGGGPVTPYERSVRGRLHHIESEVATNRLIRQTNLRALSTMQRATLLLLAISAAAGPWVALLVGAK